MPLVKKVYFTITGLKHYYGYSIFEKVMLVRLKNEPENAYDKEAIMVQLPGLGKVGYVANSTCTVLGESMSAGRLYDKIGRKAHGQVEFILDNGIICSVLPKDLCFTEFSDDEDEEDEEDE